MTYLGESGREREGGKEGERGREREGVCERECEKERVHVCLQTQYSGVIHGRKQERRERNEGAGGVAGGMGERKWDERERMRGCRVKQESSRSVGDITGYGVEN
ncbi:hypothetical protein JZ751_011451 [Albula glossodonta]|uniref:Uncharacterized protein n=1 Tax=Albula glossodonta TaxID=121402 RepID=A0A8T2N0E1_9TELE|nr:hypothetical protein JZ751_011451 [Albula glossodonta]